MAHYIFNLVGSDPSQATRLLRAGLWAVPDHEPLRDELAPGDLALVYLAAPARLFVGRVDVASAVHDWTSAEKAPHPSASPCGVALANVEEWDPPVSMDTVLSQLDRSGGARADFETAVVGITETEYETAVRSAARRAHVRD